MGYSIHAAEPQILRHIGTMVKAGIGLNGANHMNAGLSLYLYANEWELKVEKSYCKELLTFTKPFSTMSTVANDNFINVADAIIFYLLVVDFK